MNDKNNNFRDLKQLLKLKQHEIPPPGYFNRFSGEVIARIRAGEEGGSPSLAEHMSQVSWLVGLRQFFRAKPGMIGGAATSLCLVLLIGVMLADRPDEVPTGMLTSSMPAPDATAVLPEVVSAPADNAGIAVSTNPIVSLQPVATLFSQQQNPLFQSASFVPSTQ